jgi:C-terminal processing protease CtpA/Prc
MVFDLRGYPTRGARKLLNHLSGDTLRSARFQIPQFIYPDQEDIVGYDTRRWTLPPKEPQIASDVTFLTGAGAISYAESIMGIVEHYNLGTIVGQQTAGTNGNINPFELPGGYQVRWTGMRVRKHDGAQHHIIGIQPDVPVERTIDGVRAGRDEVLQTALEVL